jgi:nucleotide-binding universal stress UspA family protein
MYRILIPVDGARFTEEVIPHVHDLVLRRDAEVTLLTVLPDLVGFAASDVAEETDRAHMRLRDFADKLGVAEGKVRTELRMGSPAEEILKYLTLNPVSLVAMPTHGRTGVRRLIAGSIAETVLRNSPAPMLLTHRNPEGASPREVNRYHRILLALDGSPLSQGIVPVVEEIAITHDSEVILFHDLPGPTERGELREPAYVREALRKFRKRFEKAGLAVRIETTQTGHPAKVILHKIGSLGIDLVAMTTHGRAGFERVAFGSVAEAILRHCDVAMLVLSTRPSRRQLMPEEYLG